VVDAVLDLGGSIIVPDDVDSSVVRRSVEMLLRVAAHHRVIVVVGGGASARRYIAAGRQLGVSEAHLDELGIATTRLNARLLISALGPLAYPTPPLDTDTAVAASSMSPLVVMGGTHPGHTTDAVAAMVAEHAGSVRLVVATNVAGVYDADPKLNPKAKLITRMDADQLLAMTKDHVHTPGGTGVVDPLAARIIVRARIATAVVDGRRTDQLEAALLGKAFEGTEIVPSPQRASR